ncbi:MAG: nitrate- and nitrite sensing domain-containing protein [Acidimicrobiales bacterium]|nr:nitrate- and nitrite sensing domain-containing protein [Acidimicrobiales bacterium]
MRVGTKLAAILLAPLLVLGVLAGLGIADRAQAAADLRNAERQTALTARNNELQNALQVEQLWATTSLSRPDSTAVERYSDAVDASDAAAARLNDAVAALSESDELSEYLQTVADRLASLEGLRPAITSRSATVDAVLTGYDQVGTSLVGLQAATAGNIDVAEISNNLDDVSTLSKAKATKARRDALLAVLNTSTVQADQQSYIAEVNALDADTSRYLAQFYEEADPDFRALLRNAEAASDARTVEDAATQMLAGRTVDSINFAEASVSRLSGMLSVEERITSDVSQFAADARARSTRTAQLYLAGAVAGILAAVAVAFFVARSITRPLRRLTEAADRLATDQLPGLVDQLRAGSGEVTLAYTPIEIDTRDELGQLASSFNSVQQVTVDVAHEQSALLRKGISDIFVNLARRNQALLDRQIEFIDQLEANERDPDQLENLFRLDHLATRMRRNAESLLVLAGADPVRRRGRPVPLADVIRVAVGEVADYSRVRVRDLEDVTVNSAAAVDVAHLLAELMENATQFSPPNTTVEISGRYDRSGGLAYLVTVSDQGIGISPEHLHEFNDLLAQPPAMGLDMSRSLGFVVIGRLAKRHGVGVRLSSPHEGGVAASVLLPEPILGAARSTTASGLPSRRGDTGRPEALALSGDGPALSDNGVHAAHAEGTDAATADDDVDRAWDDAPVARRGPDSLFRANGAAGRPAAPHAEQATNGAADHADADVRANGAAAASTTPAFDAAESFTYYDVEEGYSELNEEPSQVADPAPAASLTGDATPAGAGLPPAAAAVPLDVTDNESESSFGLDGFTTAAAMVPPADLAPPPPPPPFGRPLRADDARPAVPLMAADELPPAATDEVAVDRTTVDRTAVDEAAPALPARAAHPTDTARSLFSAESMTRAAAAAAELRTAGSQRPGEAVGDATPIEDAPQLPSRRSAGLASSPRPTATPHADEPLAPASPAAAPEREGRPGQPAGMPLAPAAGLLDVAGDGASGDRRDAAVERLEQVEVERRPAGLPSRRTDVEPVGVRPSAGIASRSAVAEPANGSENLTAAGLVRRSPKQQLRAMARGDNEAASRVAASQRSPEEVRKMLSRYRSGLQRGRTTTGPPSGHDHDGAAGPDHPDLAPAHDHAAEELPWRP